MLVHPMAGDVLNEAIRLWLNAKVVGEDRTQAKVARAIGVSEERLRHWLTGRNRVPLNALQSVARYFKFPTDAAFLAEVRRFYPAPEAEGACRDPT